MARGDQLYVWRQFANLDGVYQHHGIDVGDNEVIHYRKPSEVIEITSLQVFSRNNLVYVRSYPDGFCFIDDVVISRAYSRLGENGYNLMFNNCEHFATWCKTGVSESQQIKEFIPTIDKLDVFNLFQPVGRALDATNPSQRDKIVKDALDKIKVVWHQLQPQYSQASVEVETWEKVARQALIQNREDLARRALVRKRQAQNEVNRLQKELEKLATMTEGLIQAK